MSNIEGTQNTTLCSSVIDFPDTFSIGYRPGYEQAISVPVTRAF